MTSPEHSERLTGQETRIMNLAAVAMNNAEIADALDMSVSCVKRRLGAIARKLNVTGNRYRVVLTHYALNEGLPNLFEPKRKP